MPILPRAWMRRESGNRRLPAAVASRSATEVVTDDVKTNRVATAEANKGATRTGFGTAKSFDITAIVKQRLTHRCFDQPANPATE